MAWRSAECALRPAAATPLLLLLLHGSPQEVAAAALESDTAQLAAMGFTPRKARRALKENENSIEAAVEWLMARYA